MTDATKTKSSMQLMKEAQERAAAAKPPQTTDVDAEKKTNAPEIGNGTQAASAEQSPQSSEGVIEHDPYPQLYQLPSAPCSIVFKDQESGAIRRKIFPDGVAKAESAYEHRKLESMVKNRCCYYYRGTKAQDSRQRPPAPIRPDEAN